MKYVVCLHLYIPWKFGEQERSYGAEFVFFLFFVCLCLFVRHATMLGTESLDGAYTHWTWGNGHKPPGQKSPRAKDPPDKRSPGQKHARTKIPPAKSAPGQKTPGEKVPRAKDPRTKIPPAPDTQQAATYSIAAVAGNWTILVIIIIVLLLGIL